MQSLMFFEASSEIRKDVSTSCIYCEEAETVGRRPWSQLEANKAWVQATVLVTTTAIEKGRHRSSQTAATAVMNPFSDLAGAISAKTSEGSEPKKIEYFDTLTGVHFM